MAVTQEELTRQAIMRNFGLGKHLWSLRRTEQEVDHLINALTPGGALDWSKRFLPPYHQLKPKEKQNSK